MAAHTDLNFLKTIFKNSSENEDCISVAQAFMLLWKLLCLQNWYFLILLLLKKQNGSSRSFPLEILEASCYF